MTSLPPSIDARLAALLAPAAGDTFHGVESGHDVFRPDPIDVVEIHADARQAFVELVDRARRRRHAPGAGRSLLLLGEAGAGKTHLMRAFRQQVHDQRQGFVSYAQLSSSTSNYPRYLLRQVLESLERPFAPADDADVSALDALSDALCEIDGACSADERAVLRETDNDKLLRKTAWRVGNRLIDRRLVRAEEGLDQEAIFQLLFLQNRRPTVTKAVVRFLSCAPLGARESELLGGASALDPEQDALPMLRSLSRLIAALDSGAFVLCIDQLEDAYAADAASRESFRRMMLAVRELTDSLPNAVVVIACLRDYWEAVRATLTQSLVDRLVVDPEPIDLPGTPSVEQLQAVIAARVAHSLWAAGLEPDADQPCAPLRADQLQRFAGWRLRDVLGACSRVLAMARERQTAPDFGWLEVTAAPAVGGHGADHAEPHTANAPTAAAAVGQPAVGQPATTNTATGGRATQAAWTQRWDDFRGEFDAEIPDDEAQLAELLAASLRDAASELAGQQPLEARAVASHVLVDVGAVTLRVGVCEKQARGGGLQKQLNQLWNKSVDRVAVLVRSTPFPDNPRTKIAQTLGDFVAAGHRRVVCPPGTWKAMLAMVEFGTRHAAAAGFTEWRQSYRPLLSQPVFDAILGRSGSVPAPTPAPAEAPAEQGNPAPPTATPTALPDPAPQPAPQPAATAAAAAPREPGRVHLGHGSGLSSEPLELELQTLCRHAAFLGGTGSGKTTLALSVIEQALQQGVPALLVDRKGDLATYADLDGWQTANANRDATSVARLRASCEVRLYTPGDPSGRDLAVPILPVATPGLPAHERKAAIDNSAAALVAMLNPGRAQSKAARQATAILIAALGLLDEHHQEASLGSLISILCGPDPSLAQRVGAIDSKALPKLGSEIESLRATERQLLDNGANETLDTAAMLGLDRPAGAPPALAIVNTTALGHETRIQFLVTSLLSDLRRVAESRPSDRLQALVLLDEADLYLPAVGAPPTKGPLEHGLKRFRSAGLGLLLATQSPGDLDYKGRDNVGTWFVGRVTQDTALKKLDALFDRDRSAARRIPDQQVGQFHCLQAGRVAAFLARPSLLDARQLPATRVAELARLHRSPTTAP